MRDPNRASIGPTPNPHEPACRLDTHYQATRFLCFLDKFPNMATSPVCSTSLVKLGDSLERAQLGQFLVSSSCEVITCSQSDQLHTHMVLHLQLPRTIMITSPSIEMETWPASKANNSSKFVTNRT